MKALKAEELRIGNKIGCMNFMDEPFTVIAITGSNAVKITRDKTGMEFHPIIADVEPIPLTEEWLLKFGFSKYNHGWVLHTKEQREFCIWGFSIDKMVLNTGGAFTPEVKYVHSLQNLFFALINSELNLK